VILIWEAGRPLADGPMLAELYEVSPRTVRRHCTPVAHTTKKGGGRGGGVALYDAFAAGDQLAGVAPRPERTLAALRYRMVHRGTTDGGPIQQP
jgi:hypothetical protein